MLVRERLRFEDDQKALLRLGDDVEESRFVGNSQAPEVFQKAGTSAAQKRAGWRPRPHALRVSLLCDN